MDVDPQEDKGSLTETEDDLKTNKKSLLESPIRKIKISDPMEEDKKEETIETNLNYDLNKISDLMEEDKKEETIETNLNYDLNKISDLMEEDKKEETIETNLNYDLNKISDLMEEDKKEEIIVETKLDYDSNKFSDPMEEDKKEENIVETKLDYDFNKITMIGTTGNLFTPEQYLVGCKWAPDGSCLLTNCADNRHRLFDLPNEIYSLNEINGQLYSLKPSLVVANGGSIYDYDWYPHMSSWSPPTCCFLSASSDSPVHLFDAFNGEIRASYVGYNYAEEVSTAYSIKFSKSGDKIYCGYTNFLKIFDIAVPGSQCQTFNLKHLNDQKGIVSCIEENPAMPNIFAVGTYRRTIGLYSENGDALCLIKGQKGGLTHLMHSLDGTKLYSGARGDNEILCWDLRNPGTVLSVIKRTITTNQRIYFDISYDGNYLMTGSTDGKVSFYDLSSEKCEETSSFIPHIDCTNGVSFNPKFPIIATSSGKRNYVDIISDEDDEETFKKEKNLSEIENTVKLFWIGKKS